MRKIGQIGADLPGEVVAVERAGIRAREQVAERAVGEDDIGAELPAVLDRIAQRHAPGRVEAGRRAGGQMEEREPEADNQRGTAETAENPGEELVETVGNGLRR